VVGWYQVAPGQRLDLIAYQFLKDATAFWTLCDTNGSAAPDALGAHALIAIPGSNAGTT
jgi:hypothetical protein